MGKVLLVYQCSPGLLLARCQYQDSNASLKTPSHRAYNRILHPTLTDPPHPEEQTTLPICLQAYLLAFTSGISLKSGCNSPCTKPNISLCVYITSPTSPLLTLNNVMTAVAIRHLVPSRASSSSLTSGKRFACFCTGIGPRGTEISTVKAYCIAHQTPSQSLQGSRSLDITASWGDRIAI